MGTGGRRPPCVEGRSYEPAPAHLANPTVPKQETFPGLDVTTPSVLFTSRRGNPLGGSPDYVRIESCRYQNK